MARPIVQALLGRLFDNAAMYPPAQAPMEASLALHDAAERAPWGFARGRFLVPGARLGDLAVDLPLLGLDRKALRVAVIVGSPADANATSPLDAVVTAAATLRETLPSVHVDLFEVRPTDQEPFTLGAQVDAAAEAAHAAGADNCFIEVDVAGADTGLIHERVGAVADAGAKHPIRIGTKVRCGGLEPGMVPSGAQLATFLGATRTHHLPFKATAGLHHALAAPDLAHHGFLGLLFASVLGQRHDLDIDQMSRLLCLQADGVEVTDDSFTVRVPDMEPLTAEVEDVTAARYGGFVAFGTCSFTEPVAAAAALLGDHA